MINLVYCCLLLFFCAAGAAIFLVSTQATVFYQVLRPKLCKTFNLVHRNGCASNLQIDFFYSVDCFVFPCSIFLLWYDQLIFHPFAIFSLQRLLIGHLSDYFRIFMLNRYGKEKKTGICTLTTAGNFFWKADSTWYLLNILLWKRVGTSTFWNSILW